MLCQGDEVAVFLADEILEGTDAGSMAKAKASVETTPMYSIPYQDENILVINKHPGIPVHPGVNTEGISLIELIRKDLGNEEITLCHRIDMNTGGLLLLARNKRALASVIHAMDEKLISKRYRCLVRGIPDQGEPMVCDDGMKMKEMTAFLEKPTGKGDVYIHDEAKEGDLSIITRYHVLSIFKGAGARPGGCKRAGSRACDRPHPSDPRPFSPISAIRFLATGNMGRNAYNRFFEAKKGKLKYQQLYATSLHFGLLPKGDILAYLSGRTFSITPHYDISFRE